MRLNIKVQRKTQYLYKLDCTENDVRHARTPCPDTLVIFLPVLFQQCLRALKLYVYFAIVIWLHICTDIACLSIEAFDGGCSLCTQR